MSERCAFPGTRRFGLGLQRLSFRLVRNRARAYVVRHMESTKPLRSNSSIAKRFHSAIANRSSLSEKNFPHFAHPTPVARVLGDQYLEANGLPGRRANCTTDTSLHPRLSRSAPNHCRLTTKLTAGPLFGASDRAPSWAITGRRFSHATRMIV